MKRRPADTASSLRVAQVSAACIAGALSLAVFYHGSQMPLLAGAQFLLVDWVSVSLVSSYPDGIRLPLTPLSARLTLFWMWLGISLAGSAVPAASVVNFWGVGSLALAFWAYTLSPQREWIWFYLSRFALAGALALCAYALVQLLAWRLPPRATFVNIHSFAALMVLIALPLGAYFLTALHKRSSQRTLYLLGGSLVVIFFAIAATDGRGTTLSIILCMAVLAALAGRTVGHRPIMMLVGLLCAAYVAAYLILHGELTGARVTMLVDPADAASPRLLIWRGSWEMLMNHPWWGIGLGTYYLAWPPYRDPADQSLWFFVHNDYLQIWIEAGLPALLLLLAVHRAVRTDSGHA